MITYTFANNDVVDATKLNKNYQDVVDALSDGSTDLTIKNLSATGVTILGATTLGGQSVRVATYVITSFDGTYTVTDSWFDGSNILFATACVYTPQGKVFNLTYTYFSGAIKIVGKVIACYLPQETENQYEATGGAGAGSTINLTIFMKV
jgi:hypothetical protein